MLRGVFQKRHWASGTGKASALILGIDLKKKTICFGADKDMRGDFEFRFKEKVSASRATTPPCDK